MKLLKITSLIGVLTLSASLLLFGCGGGSTTETESTLADVGISEESTISEEVTTTSGETSETESFNNSTETDDAQVDLSFTLEGKSYTLPFAYSELEADGWITDTDMNQTLSPYTYTHIYICKDGKDEDLYIDLFNADSNAQKLKDCMVSEIEFTEKLLQTYNFELVNGIKPGDDQTTVTNAMGNPTNTDDGDDFTSIVYGGRTDSSQIVFVWWKVSDDVTKEGNKITISSNEIPAYLSEYKAPASVGEDFDSSTFTLDGTVYQLPCPATEFIKNGWNIENSEDLPRRRSAINRPMEKNGVIIHVTFYNYADCWAKLENCAVTSIEATVHGDYDPIPNMQVPKGINFNMTKSQLKSAISGSSLQFSKANTSSSLSYTFDSLYDDSDEEYYAKFSYDKEKGMIDSIIISGSKWPGK
ncbi:MAG: hypothetical protein IJ137_05365 [Eubacterium sp.]|nr:hypothetical protein [Eubacterium sp.]